jgi:tetratricopeptide (TPR) repeat protein
MDFFEKANDLYNTKEYTKAIELYRKAARNKGSESVSLYNAAVCFIKLRKYNEAISLLRLALKHKTESKYYFNLGYCHAMLSNNKKALIYFNTAWSLDNDDVDCEKAINLIIKAKKKSP